MQRPIPLILSGRSRARLRPLSHDSKAKQLQNFECGHSFFREAVLRCADRTVFDARLFVAAVEALRFLIDEDLEEIDVECDILLERAARNSWGAIAAASRLKTLQMARPWGIYERPKCGCYQAKRVMVKAVGVLSSQKHRSLLGTWLVVWDCRK